MAWIVFRLWGLSGLTAWYSRGPSVAGSHCSDTRFVRCDVLVRLFVGPLGSSSLRVQSISRIFVSKSLSFADKGGSLLRLCANDAFPFGSV